MTEKDFPESVIQKTLRNRVYISVIKPAQVEFWIFCDLYVSTLGCLSMQRVDVDA